MINWNPPTVRNGPDGVVSHVLNCKKSEACFEEGKQYRVYITIMKDKRYQVFTASGIDESKHHVFASKEAVEECFDEAPL